MSYQVVHHFVDGKPHTSYSFKGVPVLHAEIEGPNAVACRKFQFAIKEMEVAQRYLELLTKTYKRMQDKEPYGFLIGEPEDMPTIQALFAAATISYGKLFSETGTGRRQFKPKDFYNGPGERFRKLHAWWMTIRHEYVAHSVSDEYDEARMILLLALPEANRKDFFWVFPHVQFRQTPGLESIEKLLSMIRHVTEVLHEAQDKNTKYMAENLSEADREKYRPKAVFSREQREWPPAPPIDEIPA